MRRIRRDHCTGPTPPSSPSSPSSPSLPHLLVFVTKIYQTSSSNNYLMRYPSKWHMTLRPLLTICCLPALTTTNRCWNYVAITTFELLQKMTNYFHYFYLDERRILKGSWVENDLLKIELQTWHPLIISMIDCDFQPKNTLQRYKFFWQNLGQKMIDSGYQMKIIKTLEWWVAWPGHVRIQ